MHASTRTPEGIADPRRRSRLAALAVSAVGIVFGDIGTSPLYALKECFAPEHGAALEPRNLLGVLSLVFWTLAIVVTVKYVTVIMRADNRGEGGILALLVRVMRLISERPRASAALALLGVFGATLFYGDAVITPAISVLSAVEGFGVLAPHLHHWIVPIALAILVGLFGIQRFGTQRVGRYFGPVMLAWFVAIAALGARSIAGTPAVLAAVDPGHAVGFIAASPRTAFLALGSVVLAVTGAEALYADMGHFGRAPIRLGWYAVVWPSLLLNYFGQGALLLRDPGAVRNPFYLLAPDWLLAPLILLATAATVIASQATISGAFSLSMQAMQLGYLPRMDVRHTSARERGQIYVPTMNWLLLAGVVYLVLQFRSSSGLAAAYGIAVTGAMLVDTVLVSVVVRRAWRWPRPVALPLLALFGAVDLAFLSANALKIPTGGWLPLTIAVALFALLTTWRRGREILAGWQRADAVDRDRFIAEQVDALPRVAGTAIFMTSARNLVPGALLHNLKHNRVLHERVVFLTVVTEDIPYVGEDRRVDVKTLGKDFHRVLVRYGFMEEPDVPRALPACERFGLALDPMECTFFIGRESIVPTDRPGMASWREHLFAWLMRNAGSATDFFGIPASRVVELGTHVEI